MKHCLILENKNIMKCQILNCKEKATHNLWIAGVCNDFCDKHAKEILRRVDKE